MKNKKNISVLFLGILIWGGIFFTNTSVSADFNCLIEDGGVGKCINDKTCPSESISKNPIVDCPNDGLCCLDISTPPLDTTTCTLSGGGVGECTASGSVICPAGTVVIYPLPPGCPNGGKCCLPLPVTTTNEPVAPSPEVQACISDSCFRSGQSPRGGFPTIDACIADCYKKYSEPVAPSLQTCTGDCESKETDEKEPCMEVCHVTYPATATTPTTNATGSALIFPNPLKFTTVTELLSSVLTNLMGIIAIISLVFIVIGGLMYITSGGSETMVTRAKKTWTGAVIGLAIAMAAPTFLKTIQTILGGNANPNGNADAWVSDALTLQDIAVNVLNLLLSIVGIIAMIAMVIGGMMYLSSAGEERKVETGKNIFKYAIMGITIALAGLILIRTVNLILTGTI